MGVSSGSSRATEARLIEIDDANFATLSCCGIKNPDHPGRREKQCWLQANAKFEVQARAVVAPDGEPAGYIEYVPGAFAWRGVDARGYLFIHCVWIYAKRYQRRGWASLLIESCVADARTAGMTGVAAMVREGPWMADRRLFEANGFTSVDTAPPDYRLLVRKLDPDAANPAFQKDWDRKAAWYGDGLTIIRSSQCPHIAKFAAQIAETAAEKYGLAPHVVELESSSDAQNAPTPYAVFALIYNGKLIADHQISRTRFCNIMNKLGA